MDHSPKIRCFQSKDTLVADSVYFTFLAEGAANAIFQICSYSSTSEGRPHFTFADEKDMPVPLSSVLNKVLRIGKGRPKTLTCYEVMSGFEDEIKPLFRPDRLQGSPTSPLQLPQDATLLFEDFLMEHEVVLLSEEVCQNLFQQLHERCPPKHCTGSHTLEDRGILLPDMSSVQNSVLMVEIKPKWLVQSPNAPRDSYRCRTCALHAYRSTEAGSRRESYICPLQLAAGNSKDIERYLKYHIRKELGNNTDTDILEAVLRRTIPYLSGGPGHQLLRYLQALQVKLDPQGVLMREKVPLHLRDEYDRRLRLCMTLRDCSLLIRVPYVDETQPIKAKLGDLDFKSSDKIEDWTEKELALINGGWYTEIQAGVGQCLIAQEWKHSVSYYM